MKRILISILFLVSFSPSVFADATESGLENIFDIYIIKPERRAAGDRVVVKGDTATIYYWESAAKRKPDEVICDAFKYLLLGRTTYGRGAKEAFEKYPAVQKIELSLYDIESGTRHGDKIAEILPTQKVFEYLKISVLRNSIMNKPFNRSDVQHMIEQKKCPEIGKTYIDSVALKQDYFKEQK